MTTTMTPIMTEMMTSVTTAMPNITCMNAMVTVIAPEDCDFLTSAALVFVIVSIVLIVWGLFTNIVLLVIIFTNGRQMRTLPNIFIANMAFLGVLFLVIVSGGNILIIGQVAFQVEIVSSDSAAKAIFLVQIYVSVASFTILVLLGFDRYLAIVHPLRSRSHRTKKRAIILNWMVWIIAGLCMLPVFISGGDQNLFESYRIPAQRTAMIIFFTIAYIIPVIALLLMYIAILKVIWFNPTTKQLHGEEQERRWKQRITVFRSIFRVTFTFILHYGYFFAIFIWIAVGGHKQVSARVGNVLLYSSILIVYLNTCINPVIYALNQQAFRPFVYKLLCPKSFHLRKPRKDALCTTAQNPDDVPTASPKTSRTLQNTQGDIIQSNNGSESTEANINEDIMVDKGSHHGYLNEGYHGNDSNENSENGSTFEDATRSSSAQHEHAVEIQLEEIEPNV